MSGDDEYDGLSPSFADAARRADEEWARQNKSDKAELLKPLPSLDVPELLRGPTPVQEWVVQDRIPRRQVVLFSGEGAAGKSTLALQLAAVHAINHGTRDPTTGELDAETPMKDWLYTLPEGGRALFIDAEDEKAVLHRRLDAIRTHYQVTPDDFASLDVVSLAGEDAVLARPERGVIKPTTLYARLERKVRLDKPILTVLASSANVFAGDELDRAQVQQFISMLTRLAIIANGAVMLLSHPSLTGINSATGISGSTQWHNAVRARIYLHAIKANGDEPADPDARILEFKKNQYGPVSEAIQLRWNDGLFLPQGTGASLDKLAHEARCNELFLTVLRRRNDQKRPVSDNQFATYAPREFMSEPLVIEAKVSRRDLELAMQRLFTAGRIKIAEWGPASKRRKFIDLA